MFCKYIYCTLSYYDSNITESSLDLRRIGPGHQLEIFLFLLHRLRLPVVPKQQHRPSPLILHDHDPEELPLLVRPVHRLPPPVGPPGQGVPDGLHVRVHAVLVLQPGLDHLKLELSHGGQDEGSPSIVVALAEGLDRSLLQQLVDALLEGFVGGGVGVADVGEFFGAEAGDAGKGDPRRTRVERIADGEISRIVDADDVSGIRHVQRLSILPEEQLRLCQIAGVKKRGWTRTARHASPRSRAIRWLCGLRVFGALTSVCCFCCGCVLLSAPGCTSRTRSGRTPGDPGAWDRGSPAS
mmetsp:Transcript_21737/g.49411  ORF Transcript_21737/g.49411 Transcript_21737/m.49411 type:complete len:296 (+) Transcript_21737:60-947(+)